MTRFIVERGEEIYYEIIDNETNEMIERFSTNDVIDHKTRRTAGEAQKKAHDLCRRLNKKEINIDKARKENSD